MCRIILFWQNQTPRHVTSSTSAVWTKGFRRRREEKGKHLNVNIANVYCVCASACTHVCVSVCLSYLAHLGASPCAAVHFCVYVPAPCLCWLTLGRSQEPLLQKQLNTTNRGHLTTDYTLQPTLEGNNALSSPGTNLWWIFTSYQY